MKKSEVIFVEHLTIRVEYSSSNPLSVFKHLNQYVSGEDAAQLIDKAKLLIKKSPKAGATIALKASEFQDDWKTEVTADED